MRRLVLLVLLGLLLVACDQTSPSAPAVTPQPQSSATQGPSSAATATGAYPAPEGAYPAPQAAQTADAYPAPASAQGPEFTLNTPVRASDTQVTGKGPAGVPVKLVNVARSAEVIGET